MILIKLSLFFSCYQYIALFLLGTSNKCVKLQHKWNENMFYTHIRSQNISSKKKFQKSTNERQVLKERLNTIENHMGATEAAP